MVSVAPEMWTLLERAHDGGALAAEFIAAWENGQALLAAEDGLRGRVPRIIEWKGSHRAPGDDVAPIDLRIDHVYLISCKYLSKIMINSSPAHLFDRLLQGGHGTRTGDWYATVAGAEYQELYDAVRSELGISNLPAYATDLRSGEKKRLADALKGGWPGSSAASYARLTDVVGPESARSWRQALKAGSAESMLWRILRMGSAPYFVLGASPMEPLRLRISTPWDWRLHYQLSTFDCTAQPGGQPVVAWNARVLDRHTRDVHEIRGHVEVRWSHGRFGGNPEAKVYLDTPHRDVPGYVPL